MEVDSNCYCNLGGKYMARHPCELRGVDYVTILSQKAKLCEINPGTSSQSSALGTVTCHTSICTLDISIGGAEAILCCILALERQP